MPGAGTELSLFNYFGLFPVPAVHKHRAIDRAFTGENLTYYHSGAARCASPFRLLQAALGAVWRPRVC